MTDRVSYKVDDIEISLKPMSFAEKMEVQQDMVKAVNGDMAAAMKAVVKALSVCLKSVKGLENADGTEYELEFDADGKVSQSCIDELLNIPHSTKLTAICSAMLNGIPTQIIDPQTSKPLAGVSLILKKEVKGKK